MNHLKINQDNTRTEINVSDNVVEKIYQEVKNYDTHDPSDLSGLIEINHGYLDAVSFLNEKYPRFRCRTLGDPYVRFEDPLVESTMIQRMLNFNNPIGDGVGLTVQNMADCPGAYYNFDLNGTGITKFNELRYFTKFTDIAGGIFRNCTSLKEIDFSNIIKVSGNSGGLCVANTGLEVVDLPICTNLTGSNAFNGNKHLTTFNAPLATGTLGSGFFRNCEVLTNVNIPNILAISTYSFDGCSSLQTLDIPKVSGYIPNYCFRNCRNLTNLTIGEITRLYVFAFQNCSSLTYLDLSNCTEIRSASLSGCTSLSDLGDTTNITIMESDSVFVNCRSLTGTLDLSNATISSTLTAMFYGCSGLTKIKLGHIRVIGGRWNSFENGRKSFYGCLSLVTLDIQQLDYIGFDNCAFGNTGAFRNFIIRNTESVPNIDSELYDWNPDCQISMSHFGGTNVKIYVTDSLLDVYKNHHNLQDIKDYFYPISEFVE